MRQTADAPSAPPPARALSGATLAAVALLACHAATAVHALRQHATTVDEGGHLVAGLTYLKVGSARVYRENPPLVRGLAALPVLASGPVGPYLVDSDIWQPIHDRFVRENRDRYLELTFRARYVIVALSVLAGWFVFLWSRALFGPAAGLVGLSLWVACPNVLAWSGVVTTDMGAAALGIIAMFAIRQYVHRPGRWLAAVAGGGLGLAELSKFSMLVLYPLWLASWLVAYRRGRGRRASRGEVDAPRDGRPRWYDLLIAPLVSLVVITAGYGFEGMFRPLGSFRFLSNALSVRTEVPSGVDAWSDLQRNRFRGTALEDFPVPLPEHFITGFDAQKSHADLGRYGYLRGQWRRSGWWYYYLYGMVVKVPIGTWVIGTLALILALSDSFYRAPIDEEVLVWLPAFAILAVISSQSGINSHVRYVLPAFPFLAVGVSRVGRVFQRPRHPVDTGRSGMPAHQGRDRPGRGAIAARAGAAVLVAAFGWNLSALCRIHPHYLSYFNEFAGGPENGWKHLLNSNIDWGQDLFFLKSWVDGHPECRPLHLAYYGGIDPRLFGLDFPLAPLGPAPAGVEGADDAGRRIGPAGPSPGWFAVSVNYRAGAGFVAYDDHGELADIPQYGYFYFSEFRPVARVGYSIEIYHITPDEANAARRRLNLPPYPGD